MRNFDYHRAADLKEACRLMGELPKAQILAGGTDLLVDIDSGLRHAEHVVSIRDVSELKRIQKVGNRISIGAGCSVADVESNELIREHLPELAEMVVMFASPQIRNRATVAGNICSAVPCGDFPPVLISLGAEVELCSSNGTRAFPLEDFFHGNRETVRQDSEILTRILVPIKPNGAAANYQKFRRRAANSLALVSVAAYLEMSDGLCSRARIVLGSVAPIPLSAKKAGRSLEGKPVDDAAIASAAGIARDEACPITDQRGTETYRRQLVEVLTKRALRQVLRAINTDKTGKRADHE